MTIESGDFAEMGKRAEAGSAADRFGVPARPSLTDFLLQRISEDEAAVKTMYRVRNASQALEVVQRADTVSVGAEEMTHAEFLDRFCEPAPDTRLLAECEAKRRIVNALAADTTGQPARGGTSPEEVGARWAKTEVCKALAAVYADHPDYRAEWRP